VHPDEIPVAAQVDTPDPTPIALATPVRGPWDHAVSYLYTLDFVADPGDDPDELMAQHRRALMATRRMAMVQRHHLRPMRELGGIAAADRGAADLEDHLVGSRGAWIRDLLDANVARPMEDGGPHLARSDPSGQARSDGSLPGST
jgi:hypothetical protein